MNYPFVIIISAIESLEINVIGLQFNIALISTIYVDNSSQVNRTFANMCSSNIFSDFTAVSHSPSVYGTLGRINKNLMPSSKQC